MSNLRHSHKSLFIICQSCFNFSCKLLILFLLLSACSKSSPRFQADIQLENQLNKSKPALSDLIELCKILKGWGSIREAHTRVSGLFTCPIGEGYLKEAGVKEASQDAKKSYYIFMTDLDKQSYADTFIQEKGYAYFSQQPSSGVIQSGTLDQFLNKDMFQRKGIQEEWRYKKIEGNWYLYYRQYYETFLP